MTEQFTGQFTGWKHVIWDLDGTLLDTYPATDGALAAALSGLGREVSLDTVRRLTRLTLDHAVRTLAAQSGLPEAEIYFSYEQHYAVLGLNHSPAMPGALGSVWLKFQSQRMMQATCTAAKNWCPRFS